MTQTNANLTWTKLDAETRTCSNPNFLIHMTKGRRFRLVFCGQEVCKGSKAVCESFAQRIESGELVKLHSGNWGSPEADAAERQQLADARQAEREPEPAATYIIEAGFPLPDEVVEAATAEETTIEDVQAELASTVAANLLASGEAKIERIGGPDNTLTAQTERDVAAMDADGDFIKPEYQMSAESRKKKGQGTIPISRPLEIKGQTYSVVRGTSADGKDTATVTNPGGDQYGLIIDGKDSKCSCPSFEHRAWCKHLDALVGDRNRVFGVAVESGPEGQGAVPPLPVESGPVGNGSIRNAINTSMPRPMPAAESRTKKTPDGKPLAETLFPDDDSEDIVRDEEPKGRGGRKGKRSNTETPADSTPAIITSRIAQDATTAENRGNTQSDHPDAAQAILDAGNGIRSEEDAEEREAAKFLPELADRLQAVSRQSFAETTQKVSAEYQKAKPAKVFSAALETLRPGTKFKQGRFRGELIDVNAGDATVSVREGSGPATVAHWSPATVVRVGEPDETGSSAKNPTADETENVIIVGGVVSENAVSSGGSVMKVNRSEYELVLSELGLPAAKLAKMSLKDLGSKLAKLPEKSSGRTIENEKAAKTLKGLLKAIENGEEVEIVGGEKPVKEGKSKATKVSANGNGNGHAKNGKAEKGTKAKGSKAAKENNGGVGKDAFGARIGSRKAQINALLSAKTPKTVKQVREEGNIPGSYIDYFDELATAKVIKGDHEKGWVLAK